MLSLPSFQQIQELHRAYAPSNEVYEIVFRHCQIVCEVAEQLLGRSGQSAVSSELVKVGCLLHDIGVYRLFDEQGMAKKPYIQHGLLGAELLREAGFQEAISRFCDHHTGVGLTKSEIAEQSLPLPQCDFMAETPEERLVMYADKFHSKPDIYAKRSPDNRSRFLSLEDYRTEVSRFGAGKVQRFDDLAAEFGEPDLVPLKAKYAY